jgi:hypothetical protein
MMEVVEGNDAKKKCAGLSYLTLYFLLRFQLLYVMLSDFEQCSTDRLVSCFMRCTVDLGRQAYT